MRRLCFRCVNKEPNNATLRKSIEKQDWEKTSRILRDHPELAKQALSEDEFEILWKDAPLETIRNLLEAWLEACKMKDLRGRNLIDAKLDHKQWDFLDVIFQESPQVVERKYASIAAMNGASLDFLNKHWNDTGPLICSVHNKDWENFGELLKDHPHLAKDALSQDEFSILWWDAPLETIQVLLEARPEAYQQRDSRYKNLIGAKIRAGQWEFLRSIIHAFPNTVTAEDVKNACYYDAAVDVIKLMLDQQPNAPLENPDIIFNLIEKNKLEHVRAVFEHCPAATELKEQLLHLTPLMVMFQKKKKINSDWIEPVLKANHNAAKQKDFDGKTALHLAYQHGAPELASMILNACPEAENERDNLGRFPRDLANQSEKDVFTPANETMLLGDNSNIGKNNAYAGTAVVVCRGDMLIRDPQIAQNEKDKKTYVNYSKQVLARHRIFETLLNEFSKMVGVDDKDVIQKAAAIQALAVQYLSYKNGTIINFGSFENPGYWYQQEVLKLVMRVYHETQCQLDHQFPSTEDDADFCMKHLDDRDNGAASPEPSDEHVKAYNELTRWLTEGLGTSSYSLQGPVLKPLQSLFNKLFIRRGQTSVSVIGDMVRGTLSVNDLESLQEIANRIKTTFPNITENQFRHPDKFDGLADFLTYVRDDINFISDSDILPYRFKANSSQKKNKDKPLWFNMNFFLQVPEYHRVGFSEMFVACELQIGLTEEINKHRNVHDAYERDRILSNQPLLKNYDSMTKEEEGKDRVLQISNCTEDDNKLIEKILFGKIATEALIPCTTTGTDNDSNVFLFENGPFRLPEKQIRAGWFTKPKRQCVNNRSLNWHALDCPKRNKHGDICAACVVAGPYKLDETKRYFVDSFGIYNSRSGRFDGTVGLYAHVGPYLIQIACGYAAYKTEGDIVSIKAGKNFAYLEQLCPVPVGATGLEVIVYGEFYQNFKYDKMRLLLTVFDTH